MRDHSTGHKQQTVQTTLERSVSVAGRSKREIMVIIANAENPEWEENCHLDVIEHTSRKQ